ncbi:MAG: hypothetical protein EOO89_26785 [Pedobacter sp.]|nr:MAG: hypothetical protein EOO89_26785 [Pedobacter sp.]
MERILKYLTYLSLIINVYFYALWTYVCLLYDQYEQRTEQFSTYFPLVPPTNNILFLALLTFGSIMLMGLKRYLDGPKRIIFIVFQGLALLLYLWQLM